MGARQNSINPAKVRQQIQALDTDPPPPVLRGPVEIRRRLSLILLCLLSSFLLLISFTPFDYSVQAYVALVPWGLAVIGAGKGRWIGLWVFLAAMAFWATGVYWLTWMALPGYLALVPFLSLYWLIAAIVVRRAFNRGVPMWVALPVVWVALEFARAYVLSGFNWFGLEQTQWRSIRLIQIADLTGRYGVSYFVAMVNGAIIDVFAHPLFARRRSGGGRRARMVFVGLGVCTLAAGALLGYGAWRLGQKTTRPGPTIGLVQRAFPMSLSGPPLDKQEIFDRHITGTMALADEGCDLIVWPESMLGFSQMDPALMALDPAGIADPRQQAYLRILQANLPVLGETIRRVRCPILGGGGMPPQYLKPAPDERLTTNSALLYKCDAQNRLQLARRYDKRHLVPFGEYVPFREGWPLFYGVLRWFVPSEQMPQLEPGRKPVRFVVVSRGEPFGIATPICFEGTFSRVCREMVIIDGEKKTDVLVNISNDGWFVLERDGGVHAGTELEQHLVQYVFRAVECRVPVVRAVNTGISASIDSNGRILDAVEHLGQRKMVGGQLVVATLVDGRVSVYSQVGDVFAVVCSLAAMGVVAIGFRPTRDANGKARKGKHAKK